MWYVRQTKPASLPLLAEAPNIKTPGALALFSNDRFLVVVDQSCNKVKVINSVYYVWKSVKLYHDISNVHLPDAISTQRVAAIANGLEKNLCLLLSQTNLNMLELSDGCLTFELFFSVNLLTVDPTDVVFFGSDKNIIVVTASDGVYLVELASGTVQ